MAYIYNKGFYTPKHPEKYKGNVRNIVYRSGLEARFMIYLDQHENIIKWSSEEFAIPYRDPITGRTRRYFPDFYIEIKNKEGNVEKLVVEIKPEVQTKPPTLGRNGKLAKNKKYAAMQYAINEAKWKAAELMCQSKGWRFQILTERNLT